MKVIILLILLPLASCSNLKKNYTHKYKKHWDFDMASQHHEFVKDYWSTTENDQHCFESNPNNKEILTVNKNYVNYAIEHFYRRLTEADIIVQSIKGVGSRTIYVVREDARFKLESATCHFIRNGGLFSINKVEYISFRLADN